MGREELLASPNFQRTDENHDPIFYCQPRLLVHIDDEAIAAVGEILRRYVPPNSAVLDLLSSWRSHWPKGHPKSRMVGLGLNAAEMEDNPDLDEHVIHDVNQDPVLPFKNASFDAVVITVSMQYVVHPVEVFRQVNRIMRPGGIFLVNYSNRMFQTKAVRIWLRCSDPLRASLIATYLDEAGNYINVEGIYIAPQAGPGGDPIYAVVSRKTSNGNTSSL